MKALTIDVSPGELIDKLTILEIKFARLLEPHKRVNVENELRKLSAVFNASLQRSETLDALIDELKGINERLWEIEDELRDCERRQDFRARFVALARSVYQTNDRRWKLKREINMLLASELIEEKLYPEY